MVFSKSLQGAGFERASRSFVLRERAKPRKLRVTQSELVHEKALAIAEIELRRSRFG